MDDTEKVRAALESDNPFQSLMNLAVHLRDRGMSQCDLVDLIDRFRALHQEDTDGETYNATLDVLDFVKGWCSPENALYPNDGTDSQLSNH
ncbi:MAG: hypothetical protein AAGJ38_09830 [Planctomycetota bacterium]